MIDAKRFKDELSALLDQLYESQNENIEAAAECIAECIAKGGVVHVFGSGHSVGLGIDIKDRVGSLVPIHIMDMADFVNNKLSFDLPKSSYAPGLISSPLHFWLPKMISKRLKEGFKTFGRNAHGFLTNEAVMIGVETRTSSPVRIVRDRDTLQHVRIQGLFPCGEGAGYAGGIVSAGVDGERCAEAAAQYVMSL